MLNFSLCRHRRRPLGRPALGYTMFGLAGYGMFNGLGYSMFAVGVTGGWASGAVGGYRTGLGLKCVS